MRFNREIDEAQVVEATEADYLSDILGTLESIEAQLESIANTLENSAKMQADFYSEFMRRLSAAESSKRQADNEAERQERIAADDSVKFE